MQKASRLQVEQDRETLVQVESNNAFAWRYAYARAAETCASGDTGQDYLTLSSDDRTFLFAVCDGVSQSFYGGLAAQLVGDALITWLESDLPNSTNPQVVQQALSTFLCSLTGAGTAAVQQQALPGSMPAMLRDVLEQKRSVGTETTFVCGRIDAPSTQLPDGHAVLAWMGDSRLRIWGEAGERTAELGDTFQTSERWGSVRGLVGGVPHIFVAPTRENGVLSLQRVSAYSDGLALLDTIDGTPSSSDLNSLISQANNSPTSDDISLLEVWLRKPV